MKVNNNNRSLNEQSRHYCKRSYSDQSDSSQDSLKNNGTPKNEIKILPKVLNSKTIPKDVINSVAQQLKNFPRVKNTLIPKTKYILMPRGKLKIVSDLKNTKNLDSNSEEYDDDNSLNDDK